MAGRTPPPLPAGAGLLWLYPGEWRERYEPEVLDLLEVRPVGWRGRLDLLRGALDAHRHVARPTRLEVAAALVAGAAWTIAGASTMTQPVLPDWPGYVEGTLPFALIGVVAGLVATLAVAHRLGDASGRAGDLALRLAVTGQIAWFLALAVAMAGGPYGAITALAASVGAMGLVGLGLVALRAGDAIVAPLLVAIGVAFLVPSPFAWLIAGAAWTAVGIRAGMDRIGAATSRPAS